MTYCSHSSTTREDALSYHEKLTFIWTTVILSALTHWSLRDVVINFKSIIFQHVLWIKFMSTSYEIALKWMPQNQFDDKSTLVQVMALCHQATSHYLSHCWPRYIWCHMTSLCYNDLKCLKLQIESWSSVSLPQVSMPSSTRLSWMRLTSTTPTSTRTWHSLYPTTG